MHSRHNNTKSLLFDTSVDYLKELGFKVEPGPGPDEITVMFEENGGPRSYSVFEASSLPSIVQELLRHSKRTIN